MYRCRMKIAVFSKDTMLYELVRSLEPLEHFTHEITVAPEANQEIMRESGGCLAHILRQPPALRRPGSGRI